MDWKYFFTAFIAASTALTIFVFILKPWLVVQLQKEREEWKKNLKSGFDGNQKALGELKNSLSGLTASISSELGTLQALQRQVAAKQEQTFTSLQLTQAEVIGELTPSLRLMNRQLSVYFEEMNEISSGPSDENKFLLLNAEKTRITEALDALSRKMDSTEHWFPPGIVLKLKHMITDAAAALGCIDRMSGHKIPPHTTESEAQSFINTYGQRLEDLTGDFRKLFGVDKQ